MRSLLMFSRFHSSPHHMFHTKYKNVYYIFANLLYQTTHWGNLTLYLIINGMSKFVLFGHTVEDITTKLNNGPVDKEILFIRFIDALVLVRIVVYVCLNVCVFVHKMISVSTHFQKRIAFATVLLCVYTSHY